MLITLTVKNEADGGHIYLKKVGLGGEKEIGSIHYENNQDKDWLLKVLMEGHSNVALMGDNEKSIEVAEQEYKPCCFFGAMIDALAETDKKSS